MTGVSRFQISPIFVFVPFLSAVLFAPDRAEAQRKYGIAGCGLGSVLFGTSGGVFAYTTNSSSGNQVFGITSGTSNCLPDRPGGWVRLPFDVA